MFKHQIYPK